MVGVSPIKALSSSVSNVQAFSEALYLYLGWAMVLYGWGVLLVYHCTLYTSQTCVSSLNLPPLSPSDTGYQVL